VVAFKEAAGFIQGGDGKFIRKVDKEISSPATDCLAK
jgi:hypothetical protein